MTSDSMRGRIWIVAGLALAAIVAAGAFGLHERGLADRLLVTDPSAAARDPALVRYAARLAAPAYAANCASCHGEQMQGSRAHGAPNLKDRIWLYESGGVGEIERTILYGIRSGHAKSRNITDMPPLGRNLQLTPAEARDVTVFVRSMTGPEPDAAAVQRGAAIFQGKGVCYDCHSADASGNPDYGAPALNDREWLYGGDFDTVYQSVYSGRHGVCPAWIDKLRPKVIRALAVYLNQISRGALPAPGAKGGQAHG
jgi:cytochrome c oxidase cbb3-type subunit 3